MEEEKVLWNLKWSQIREFSIFIFALLMFFNNKSLVQSIQEEKKQDKKDRREDKKQDNEILGKAIQMADDVAKYKKSIPDGKDTNSAHFIDSDAGNSK